MLNVLAASFHIRVGILTRWCWRHRFYNISESHQLFKHLFKLALGYHTPPPCYMLANICKRPHFPLPIASPSCQALHGKDPSLESSTLHDIHDRGDNLRRPNANPKGAGGGTDWPIRIHRLPSPPPLTYHCHGIRGLKLSPLISTIRYPYHFQRLMKSS
jgi:hypothetical protein